MKRIALALILSVCFIACEQSKSADEEPRAQTASNKKNKQAFSSKKLINPLVACSDYNDLYLDELVSLKNEFPLFADSLCKAIEGLRLSVYFKDLNNGMSVSYQPYRKFSPASLMKVPIMLAVFKKEEREPGFLNKQLTYLEEQGGRVPNLDGVAYADGQAYSVLQLTENMIEFSDNVAVPMLLELMGIKEVKNVEEDLGVKISLEVSEMDSAISIKSYSSFFRVLYNCSYLSRENSMKALEFLSKSHYNGGIRKAVPKEIKVAHKYGQRDISSYVKEVEDLKTDQLHHVGIVYRPHKPYLLGIMLKNDRGLEELQDVLYLVAKRIDDLVCRDIEVIERSGLSADIR